MLLFCIVIIILLGLAKVLFGLQLKLITRILKVKTNNSYCMLMLRLMFADNFYSLFLVVRAF